MDKDWEKAGIKDHIKLHKKCLYVEKDKGHHNKTGNRAIKCMKIWLKFRTTDFIKRIEAKKRKRATATTGGSSITGDDENDAIGVDHLDTITPSNPPSLVLHL